MADQVESGACECDVLETAHEVRKLRVCTHCGSIGKDLHEWRVHGVTFELLHTKCAVAKYGLEGCVTRGFGPEMRLCCLGDEGMAKLLDLMEARRGA